MATGKTWSISVPITKDGGTWGYIRVYFQEDYDSVNNYSTIRITKLTGSNTIRSGNFYSAGSVSIDGSTWYSWNTGNWTFGGLAGDSEFTTYSGASYPSGKVIYHNDDGSKTINVSVTVTNYYGSSPTWTGKGGTVSQSVALTSIPRASGLTAGNGTLGITQTLAVDRKATAYTHTITYQCGSATGTICEKSNSTSISWTPPMELARQNTTGRLLPTTITVYTYSGNTLVGTNSVDITLTIPESVCLRCSDGWATVVPYNTGTAADGMDVFVQNYSRAKVSFDSRKIYADSAYGATIASYQIKCNGKTFTDPYHTEVLSTAGNITITATVIDSRGHAVSEDFQIFVEAYSNPGLTNISVFRCNSFGVETDEGTYVSVTAASYISSIAGLNSAKINVNVGNVVSEEIQDGVTTIVGDALVLNTYTYPVTLTVTDALGNVGVYTQLLATADVMFHARKGGGGAAYGKYAEEDDLLDVNWNIRGRKNMQIDGALYVGDVSARNVYAMQLRIGGKALWDYIYPVGALYMSVNGTSPADLFGGAWAQVVGMTPEGIYAWKRIEGEIETYAVVGRAVAGKAIIGKR